MYGLARNGMIVYKNIKSKVNIDYLFVEGKVKIDAEYPTVQTMTVDFESKIVTITFLPKSPLTEKQIHEAISYAGYEVISISY